MEGLAACFEDLADSRAGNAGRHDLVEIMVIALCTVLCGGHILRIWRCFRAGEGSVSSTRLEARKGIAEPRPLLPAISPPRSGTVQRLLPKVHGQVFASLPRRHRHRRQGVASLLRQGATETAYYLCSTPITAKRGGDVVRGHWRVESRSHWRLDVTMNEDAARNRMDNGPNNLAVLRHMALNVIGRKESKTSPRAKFKKAAWNHDCLVKLLALF